MTNLIKKKQYLLAKLFLKEKRTSFLFFCYVDNMKALDKQNLYMSLRKKNIKSLTIKLNLLKYYYDVTWSNNLIKGPSLFFSVKPWFFNDFLSYTKELPNVQVLGLLYKKNIVNIKYLQSRSEYINLFFKMNFLIYGKIFFFQISLLSFLLSSFSKILVFNKLK